MVTSRRPRGVNKILITSSYIVSKLVHLFLRHSVVWGCRRRRVEWRYFRIDHIKDGGHEIGVRLMLERQESRGMKRQEIKQQL